MFFKEKECKTAKEVVSCETCKCLVKKEDAQQVFVLHMSSSRLYYYYCREHEKPYYKQLDTRYYASIEVSEDGTPIGYIKAPTKK